MCVQVYIPREPFDMLNPMHARPEADLAREAARARVGHEYSEELFRRVRGLAFVIPSGRMVGLPRFVVIVPRFCAAGHVQRGPFGRYYKIACCVYSKLQLVYLASVEASQGR